MSTWFENPTNGYKEGVSSIAWLWCLLFGFFYFAVKGVWRHALLGIIFAILTAGIRLVNLSLFCQKGCGKPL